MKLTYGYSKDHRPDLKQAILSLTVSGAASVPIWMEPLDGNSSDKKNFHETIKKVRDFQKQIKSCPEFKWIADSALYTKDKLLKQEGYLWLSRVPETILEAKKLLEKSDKRICWKERAKGYKTASFFSKYGGVKQRWLLVYSQQGYDREKKTFERKLKDHEETLAKALWHLSNQSFSGELDAGEAVKKVVKKYHYHRVEMDIVPIESHQKRGRPRMREVSVITGYQIRSRIRRDEEEIEKFLNRKGRFILATNDLDEDHFADETMLLEYKQQQEVERGFRFLKDPWFMVDSVFLKSPRRIEALMMIMTLCLMVYNIGQYRLRETLKQEGQMLPNQLNKPVQNPTLRWIFQIMEGISVVRFYKDYIEEPVKEFVANLNDLRKKIIRLFGDSACQIYGIS